MKNVYALVLFLLASFTGFSQTTVTFYAIGAGGGSNTTGSAKFEPGPPAAYTRTDNVIAVANSLATKQTGYAMFDISGIPPGSVISSVKLGTRIVGTTTGGVVSPTLQVLGRIGVDYSNTTTYPATTLYNACLGSPAPVYTITTTPAPTAVGEFSVLHISTSQTLCAMVDDAVSGPSPTSKIAISFKYTNVQDYVLNIGGETNPPTTTGLHAPYLEIVYCSHPTITSATLTPTPICSGQTFTVTGVASDAGSYRWRGPNGFNVPSGTAVGTASVLAAGVYTLTAYTACGAYSDSTVFSSPGTTLTVNPSPATLTTTTTTVCVGNTVMMSDVTLGGAWISSNTSQATVSNTGVVTAISSGYPVISYRLNTCLVSATVTVNDPPGPITGLTEVCASGGQITLSDNITGGTWSSTSTNLATVDPNTGVVTGVIPGAANIDYFTGGCPTVSYPLTVNPLPNPITGATVICVNATTQLSTTTAGGTWTSGNTALAVVNPTTGVVTGTGAGSPVDITYTLPTGCFVTHAMTVNPQPGVISGPSNICVDQCTTLSDATPAGTWSSSSLANATVDLNTGDVCGLLAGAVNITYTSSTNACYILHPLTVNPLPSPIIAPLQLCSESVFNLSDADAGGVWSSGVTTVATIDPATGVGQTLTPGSALITYTFPSTSCYTATVIPVLPLPISTITPSGPTTFCTGDDVTLTGPVGPGYTYQWFSNGSTLLGETNITYLSNSTEVITLVVTDANGCSKKSADEQISLIQGVAIAAGGPVVFCQPSSVLLSVPLAPGIVYQWKLNGTAIPGANSNTYGATVNGSYTADLVVPGGCFSTTPPFTVTVHDMPHPPVAFNGTSINTVTGYFSYQWFLNTIAIPGATGISVTPTVNGQYIVRVIDGNGCVGYSPTYILNLGVQQVANANISIYPNPANTVVNINAPMSLKAVVTSIDGRILLEQENATQVDISKLPNGLYMIMLYNNNGDRMLVQKLTKE